MDGLRKKGIVGGKLRWNAVLNGASMRGTYYGNTAGTLGPSPISLPFPGAERGPATAVAGVLNAVLLTSLSSFLS